MIFDVLTGAGWRGCAGTLICFCNICSCWELMTGTPYDNVVVSNLGGARTGRGRHVVERLA